MLAERSVMRRREDVRKWNIMASVSSEQEVNDKLEMRLTSDFIIGAIVKLTGGV